jgi:hypothetical protein
VAAEVRPVRRRPTGPRGLGRAALTAGLALALGFIPAPTASARRLPGPGGKISVVLPPELVGPTTEAHLFAPIVEPALEEDPAAALARPPLAGFPAWRSSIVKKIVAEEGGKLWRLAVDAPAPLVGEALARCFSKRTEGSWPADVLRARGVNADISAAGAAAEVRIRFSAPVGPVPELLAGCSLRTASSGPTGSYSLVGPGVLAWKSGSFVPPALPGLLEITSGGRADIVAGGPEAPGTATLLAPFPDVVLLLQTPGARAGDPFGLQDRGAGMRGFRQALRADLLAAAYAQGRGAMADGILPPGVAPARPLPPPQGPEVLAPLSLAQLPADAPRLLVERAEGDELVEGVVERLAVILRNRGTLVDVRRATAEPLQQGVEILRWRAPTADPALALLALAGKRKELLEDEAGRAALADPKLLSPSREERVAAALALERAWLDAGAAVPLMTADRWFIVDPDLRGVQIREDAVPLLFDATFAVSAGGGR